MKEAMNDAKGNLAKAQEQMKRRVDKARRAEEWTVGDKVLLSTRNLRTFAPHLPPKLKRRYVGPFTIVKVVSPVAFRLDLPPGWQIHPTFHASNLKAYIRHPDFEREVEPPPPELVDGNLEYEVEAILRHRGKGARRQYLVSWKGYDLSEATWEPESHLANAPGCPGRLPAPREDRGAVYADQRSSNQCRGCLRGFTIAGVQSYGKGRAGDGLATAVWVTGTEPAHSAVAGYRCSSAIRRPS